MTLKERLELRRRLYFSLGKLDVLEELLADDSITEIMVNGWRDIFIEREGKLKRWEKQFTSKAKLEDVIQQIVGDCNRVVNESSPIVDARLANGSRVNVVLPPIALNGPILTIRRFPDHAITLEDLVKRESLTKEAADFLKRVVAKGYSIMIGGGTSSGKTTFLNALSNHIPKDERIITIEDSAELQIQGISNLVRLEAKEANVEGNKTIRIRDLIKTALRMRPNRIIVGECRSEETLDLLQALNTGHDGSLSTAHANSIKDMVSRLETMVLMGVELPLEAIRRQIASGIEILVHLGRDREGKRKVMEIGEVIDYDQGEVQIHILYERDSEGQLYKKEELFHREKIKR
ncbi:MAG TPA: CpaF family protein [Lachnospiraceae bacterium]